MDKLPNELLLDIAHLLPKFDLTLSFAKVSRRWFFAALSVVQRPKRQSQLEGDQVLKEFLTSDAGITYNPHPYIQYASSNILCALSFNTLTFSKITETAGRFQRSDISWDVTYDANLECTPQTHRTLIWAYGQFSILSFPDEGPPQPRTVYKRALAGRKNITFSRTGRYLVCSARTFAYTVTELHDTSRATSEPLREWVSSLQCIDISPDEQSFAYVNSLGQILVQRIHEGTSPPRLISDCCCDRYHCILSIKYSHSGEQIIAVSANGQVYIHDLKANTVRTVSFELTGPFHSAAIHMSPNDDFVAITADHGASPNNSHELRVICLQTGAVVFTLSQPRVTTSSYEFICFLPHHSGIVLVVNGKLNCWIFPVAETEQLRPIRLVAALEDEICQGRVVALGAQDLLVGGADGRVRVVELPGLERVLFGEASGCQAWTYCD